MDKPKEPPDWQVFLAAPAEAVYNDLAKKAEQAKDDPTNAHVKTLRMVDEALDALIPANPMDRKYALAGNLSNIFRLRKGRMRIYWICSSVKRIISVLFISDTPRKEGDAFDPYQIFGQMVMSGQFNNIFAELGVKIPGRSGASYETH
jgi:mRNA-degrading endonuclease RelE of RelBE toxin-antitoxin system